jgi:hypothetical protein
MSVRFICRNIRRRVGSKLHKKGAIQNNHDAGFHNPKRGPPGPRYDTGDLCDGQYPGAALVPIQIPEKIR